MSLFRTMQQSDTRERRKSVYILVDARLSSDARKCRTVEREISKILDRYPDSSRVTVVMLKQPKTELVSTEKRDVNLAALMNEIRHFYVAGGERVPVYDAVCELLTRISNQEPVSTRVTLDVLIDGYNDCSTSYTCENTLDKIEEVIVDRDYSHLHLFPFSQNCELAVALEPAARVMTKKVQIHPKYTLSDSLGVVKEHRNQREAGAGRDTTRRTHKKSSIQPFNQLRKELDRARSSGIVSDGGYLSSLGTGTGAAPSERRGRCLVICNGFQNTDPDPELAFRPQAVCDAQLMKSKFEELTGNSVTVKSNVWDKKAFHNIFDDFANMSTHDCLDYLVVFISTHGATNKLYLEDGSSLCLYADVLYYLDQKYPNLDLPKLFFVQACQDDDTEEELNEDSRKVGGGGSGSIQPKSPRCYMGMSTLPLKKAFAQPCAGSLYAQAIHSIFRRGKRLCEMHDQVRQKVEMEALKRGKAQCVFELNMRSPSDTVWADFKF